MTGSLRGPRAKVERAKKHINELEATLGGQFATISHNTHPDLILREEDSDAQKAIYKLGGQPSVPDPIAAMAGDVIHNLRSALDLLITQLILAADNTPGKEYFPVADRRKKFKARCKAEIEGRVGQDALDLIKATEAYRGGKSDPIWRIHRLDIEDKHRLLFLFGMVLRGQTLPMPLSGIRETFRESIASVMENLYIREVYERPADRPMLHKGDVLYSCPLDVEQDPKFRVEIAFGESEIVQGEPLFPTLLNYTQFIEATLEPFGRLLSSE